MSEGAKHPLELFSADLTTQGIYHAIDWMLTCTSAVVAVVVVVVIVIAINLSSLYNTNGNRSIMSSCCHNELLSIWNNANAIGAYDAVVSGATHVLHTAAVVALTLDGMAFLPFWSLLHPSFAQGRTHTTTSQTRRPS